MATLDLYLYRHAHAGDRARWSGPDGERPLSEKGRGQATRVADLLARVGGIDAVVSSPLVRARQTAEPLADRLGLPLRIDDRLAGLVELATIDAIVGAAGDPGSIALVGHDPDFSDLLGELTGLARPSMRKGAVARIVADRPLAPLGGSLAWLAVPEIVPG